MSVVLSNVLKCFGILCIVGAIFPFSQMNSHENGIVARMAYALAAGVLSGGGVLIVRFSKRLVTKSAVEVLAADPRPPVLYLRSFKDDEVMDQTNTSVPLIPSLTTEEEQLATAFHEFGPFVAVGTPSETMSQAGAARMRFHESEWRDRVVELMDRAGLVVLRIGATEGLAWEVSMSAWRVPPHKLVLLISGDKQFYDEFVKVAGARFRKPLPEFEKKQKRPPPGTVRAIIRFSQEFDPQFIQLSVPRMCAGKPLTVALRSALREVAEANGVHWQAPKLSWVKVGAVIIFALLMVYGILDNRSHPF